MSRWGLTGGIGSGKSLVCQILEKLGVPVYYADKEARRLMNTDEELRHRIIDRFGREAYEGNGLNREFLATQVFGDEESLTSLNELVHPAVRKDFSDWAETHREAPYVVEEAAILFESGADRFLDGSILVYAPEELRIQRVMLRDDVDEESVRRRMMHQMDEEEKKQRADHVIYNDGKELLLPQVLTIHNRILNSNR